MIFNMDNIYTDIFFIISRLSALQLFELESHKSASYYSTLPQVVKVTGYSLTARNVTLSRILLSNHLCGFCSRMWLHPTQWSSIYGHSLASV